MAKIHRLPVKPFILKYLANELHEGVYRVPSRILSTTKNTDRIQAYFEKNKNSQFILLVEMDSSKLDKLYALKGQLERDVRDRIFAQMAYAYEMHIPAISAARNYLNRYNITEEDYDLTSLYRTWQRRKEKYLRIFGNKS